jgi:uncharacterized membrane protein YfcA
MAPEDARPRLPSVGFGASFAAPAHDLLASRHPRPDVLAQLTPTQIALVTVILVIAGMTKGLLGVGLPLIAVPLLSQVVSVPLAIMTLAVSTVVSNAYQAIQGRDALLVARRFWTLLVPFVITLFLAARLLVVLNDRTLGLILGSLLLVFTVITRVPRFSTVRVEHERYLNPLVGILAGFLGGVSSFFGPVLLMYAVALRLPKALFVSAMSTFLFCGALPLIISLIAYGMMGRDQIILSSLSLIPVFIGLLIGQKIQTRMPQEAFRKGITAILVLTGASLILRTIFGGPFG